MKTVCTIEEFILETNKGEKSLKLMTVRSTPIQEIAQVLSKNTTLTALDFSGCGLGVDGAYALAAGLAENTTLIWLNLSFNNVGDEGAQALAKVLANHTGLTSLSLQKNQIGYKGAQALAEALSRNSTLTALTLDGNKVGAKGAQAFAEALSRNTTLAELNLCDSGIGADGGCALAVGLTKNTTLTSLSLVGNGIGRGRLQAFAEAIAKNIGLTKLYLASNNGMFCGDFYGAPLTAVEALTKNTTLTSFDIDYHDLCAVREEDGRRLRDWMARNEKIQGLSMSRADRKWQEIKTPAIGYVHGGNTSSFFVHFLRPQVMDLALSFAQKPY